MGMIPVRNGQTAREKGPSQGAPIHHSTKEKGVLPCTILPKTVLDPRTAHKGLEPYNTGKK